MNDHVHGPTGDDVIIIVARDKNGKYFGDSRTAQSLEDGLDEFQLDYPEARPISIGWRGEPLVSIGVSRIQYTVSYRPAEQANFS